MNKGKGGEGRGVESMNRATTEATDTQQQTDVNRRDVRETPMGEQQYGGDGDNARDRRECEQWRFV